MELHTAKARKATFDQAAKEGSPELLCDEASRIDVMIDKSMRVY
jgi:hypothetical protein